LTKYAQEIAEGKLVNDKYQRHVIQKLERVYKEVQNYQPQKRNVISRIFSNRRATNAPKGIYLYGAVGGGRTMLMDLFYDCCEVCTILMQKEKKIA
jgi:protein AFG1